MKHILTLLWPFVFCVIQTHENIWRLYGILWNKTEMLPNQRLYGVKINTVIMFHFCDWSSCWCVWQTPMWRLTCKLADSNINKFPGAQLVSFRDFTSSVDPKQNQIFRVTTHQISEFSDIQYVSAHHYNRTTTPFSYISVPHHICVHPLKNGREKASSSSLSALVSLVCDGWVFLLSVSYSLDFSLSPSIK